MPESKLTAREVIESIKKLPPSELKTLLNWIEEFEEELWDREFERDVKEGKLEALAQKAIKDFRQGKCTEL